MERDDIRLEQVADSGIQEVVGSISIGSTKNLNRLCLTDHPEDSRL